MKLQNIISIALLAVYSLVLTHSFVSHHHHTQFVKITEHSHSDEHHHHHSDESQAQVNHNHKEEAHVHCNFEDIILRSRKLNNSEVFVLAAVNKIIFKTTVKQPIHDYYIIPHILEPHCRDVQLRGPPQYS